MGKYSNIVSNIISGGTANISGYDLTDPDSHPDLAFVDATRTFSCSVKSGQLSFHFWVHDKKTIKTTTQSVVIPDVTGTYYLIFDETDTLTSVAEDAVVQDDFYAHAITGLVYWNATASAGMSGGELHGILMDPRDHHYNHSTFGARYESGLKINGLVDGAATYTETTSGYFWDEDIQHVIPLQSTHPFLYKLGATGEWFETIPDNNIGFENGTSNVVFNEWTGTIWQLTESGPSTDYMIYFLIATPDLNGFPVKKVIGQNGYNDRNAARNAIESEKSRIKLYGLPSPEFVFLSAYIVRQNGELKDLEDGSTHIDFVNAGGGGSASGSANVAADVNTTTTNFNGQLSTTDTTVQLSLDTLDDHTHDVIDGGTLL